MLSIMATFQELYSIISSYETITIWGHGLPDGDCYGSQVALKNMIQDSFPEKHVYIYGSGNPEFFDILGPMDQMDESIVKESLGILVDVSCLSRVECKEVYGCKAYIKFDHHSPNRLHEGFPHPGFVDHDRIAACEILYDFAVEMGLKISKIAAEALYLGMATDSGKFIYHGTTPHTVEAIAHLHECGADFKKILEVAYYERPEVRSFKAFMKRHAKTSGQVCYLVIHKDTYARYGVTYEEGSSFVNAIAGKYGRPIYALFAEDEQGNYRVELRSNKLYPVHPTAVRFGGGGHMYAAGCSIIDGKPTVEEILAALNEVQPNL